MALDDLDSLINMLKQAQEPLGFQMNCDSRLTRDLVQSLLVNRERFGYMACPCRLAAGVQDEDSDIICPCSYRQADVEEFGSCYCNLYVSEEYNRKGGGRQHVPERRPPEKMGF